jgi:hypothetical protein
MKGVRGLAPGGIIGRMILASMRLARLRLIVLAAQILPPPVLLNCHQKPIEGF